MRLHTKVNVRELPPRKALRADGDGCGTTGAGGRRLATYTTETTPVAIMNLGRFADRGMVTVNSLPSLSPNVPPAPRRIQLPSGTRCSFALICALYFTGCQRTIGPEPFLGTVGASLAAPFIVVLLGGGIRRRVSEPTAIRSARASHLFDSSSVAPEEVAWRYTRKQSLDEGGQWRQNQ